ncbi:zinc transporter ZupT [Peloplasma aerotolerans]|uniref:Zinc transporter ZupT n=1 Tax=Peloplasma aerotolerans TaxID=3044389 RepID=A0AAW6U5C6_9MOLU|nr:zinc transporter ZupT [Mariniplasma sp. M4Ah]MDI6453188.1 zinc transporter ZupT [Mariniplasma sp. M4Ah]MDR4968571.1 zinc transporter ZupT [Acholeplasmataceae bacterium]
MSQYVFPFLLTLFAGLSTGIGGIIAFHKKASSKKFLAFALGLSAGVMIYVSFIEIFPKAFVSLSEVYGVRLGYLYTTLAFFLGVFLIALIDKLVPKAQNPHEPKGLNVDDESHEKNELLRMGMFSALAIAIHNFPEGLATFIAALESPVLGISIAVAIAIHNIPEGIAVAVPIYHATKSKKKAFMYSFLSGLAEPVGAVIGFFLLYQLLSESLFGIVFAMVAGIMVYISLDELLPTAEKHGEHHIAIYGLITGMIVMAASLVLFI